LRQHPGHQADWEIESGLNDALERLPDAPVPSNFTARVLQQIEAETRAGSRREQPVSSLWKLVSRWLPRTALVALLAGTSFASYHHLVAARQAEYVRSVATLSQVAMPAPEILKDFEAIRALSPQPKPDDALLALLK
jgi:hypothetical protein